MSYRFSGIVLVVFLSTSGIARAAEPLPFLMPSDFHHLERIAWRVEEGQQDDCCPEEEEEGF